MIDRSMDFFMSYFLFSIKQFSRVEFSGNKRRRMERARIQPIKQRNKVLSKAEYICRNGFINPPQTTSITSITTSYNKQVWSIERKEWYSAESI